MPDRLDDPALAGTRTALAWQRSLLLVAATAGSLAKVAISDGQEVLGIAVACGLLLVAGTLYAKTGRARRPSVSRDETRRALLGLLAISLLAAVLSFSIMVTLS